MTILFVCSGNTCRSPLAVAAWRYLQRREKQESALHDTTVLSAGLAARKGALVSPRAAEVARGWGVNLEAHRARVLALELMQRSTLICPMTAEQALLLREEFPCLSTPVVPLGRYETHAATEESEMPSRNEEQRFRALLEIEDSFDIEDPFGGSARVYRDCGARILRCVRGLRHALREGKGVPDSAA